jgi:hypothetical protein
MRVLQFIVGFFGAASVAAGAVLWLKNRRRQKMLNHHLSVDTLLSVDRAFRESELPSPEDLVYCGRVKERMKYGKGCLHPPLYDDQGGSIGDSGDEG